MTQQPTYVYRNADQIVTFAEGPYEGRVTRNHAGVIKKGTLVTRGRRILWIGPDKEYTPAVVPSGPLVEFDVTGQIILPGLIDPHTHLLYGGHRARDWLARFEGLDYQTIAERGGGILYTVKMTRETRDDVLIRTLYQRLDHLFASGVTTVEIKTGYGLNERDEFRLLRILQIARQNHPVQIVRTFLGAHAIPPDRERTAYLQWIVDEAIPQLKTYQMAEYVDVFCDEGYYTPEETLAIVRAAREHGIPVRLHVDELNHTGLVSKINDWNGIHSVDHLERISPEEIDILIENEITMTLLPATCFHLHLSAPPITDILKKGSLIALGSDHNPGTNPVLNPWYTLWIACVAWGLSPLQALAGMTVNAAASLRLHGRIGRLAPGLGADFIVVDVPHYIFCIYQWDYVPVRFVVREGRPYRITEQAVIQETWQLYEPDKSHGSS